MATIAREEAAAALAALAARVEAGETIVVTRDGKPVLDLVPHRRKDGFDLEAGHRCLRENGFPDPPPFAADDVHDPLPEDFLPRPIP